MSDNYVIQLCVAWNRVAEVESGTFMGVVRNLAVGEWRLEGAIADLDIQSPYTPTDVDTIRVLRNTTIVFAGFVWPVSDGVGGLELVDDRYIYSGPDLWAALTTRLAYPTPSTEAPWTDSHDTRTGLASTVAAGFIERNAGYLALPDRVIPGLTVIDGAVGLSSTWSARLQPLDQVVARVCKGGFILCRVAVSIDGAITVSLSGIRDRRSVCLLSDQGDLSKIQLIHKPAPATFIVAGGQGELTARIFAASGYATGAARRESFLDYSSLPSWMEVAEAATARLAASEASLTVRAELTDTASSRLVYLTDYEVGDLVATEIEDVRYPVTVSSVVIEISPSRKVIRPVLGDASPNQLTSLVRDVGRLSARLESQIA